MRQEYQFEAAFHPSLSKIEVRWWQTVISLTATRSGLFRRQLALSGLARTRRARWLV
jgi:hypothetical protein